MISKELLNEVLPDKQIDQIRITDNTLWFKKAEMKMSRRWSDECINIYELAHKCKIWAITKNVYICSFSNMNGGVADVYNGFSKLLFESRSLANSERQTEVEAIFKACEWILKEINK